MASRPLSKQYHSSSTDDRAAYAIVPHPSQYTHTHTDKHTRARAHTHTQFFIKIKYETELTASVLKKRSKAHKRLKECFFNWTKQDRNFVRRKFVLKPVSVWLYSPRQQEKSSRNEGLVLSCFVQLKSVLLISCVF